jgi:molybdopterin molybdotransferase
MACLELQEALARILAAVSSPAGEEVALSEAAGRVAAERLAAPLDLPSFDNSSMDGYAVRAADVAAACPEAPVRLRLCGRIAAGQGPAQEVLSGACARLFTGSPMPPGADAVVMQEDTRVLPEEQGMVLVLDPVKPGENVRRRGEDVRRGAAVAEAGDHLSAGRISLLAAMGCARVLVGRRPVAGLLATGSELREPGQPLAPGQIYESTRLALAALVRGAGAVPMIFPLVADTPDATRNALAEALAKCDVVVSTGGVSVGELDFVKDALAELGGTLEFWRVAIKPGRPFCFGRRRGKLLFGLPGNPVSALVTFLLLVRPALLRWQGAREVALPSCLGRLAEPLANPDPRPHFLRVKVDAAGQVYSAGLQAAHALGSLAAANGLVEVPPRATLPLSTPVTVMRWE